MVIGRCAISNVNSWGANRSTSSLATTPARVTLTVAGSASTTVSYSGNSSASSTASSVAYLLVQAINADANQLVTASASGATISLVARVANASTNFPVSISSASTAGFAGPSFG